MNKHRRTWLTKYREDQSDITALCIFMAFIIVFHLVMRHLMIFSMVTLRIPIRLTMDVQNFPYRVIDLVVVIACLILLASLIHLVGLIRKRWAIKAIAVCLVVSSFCLIANGTILRTILKSAEPSHIAKLDPDTCIIDVDKRGRVCLYDVPFSRKSMNSLLKARNEKGVAVPVIICADYRARFSDVASVWDICRFNGHPDVELARLEGFDRYKMPTIKTEQVSPSVSSNMTTRISILSIGFALDGRSVAIEDLGEVLKQHIAKHPDNLYVIQIAADAWYDYVLRVLQSCQDNGATNLVWEPIP